MSWVGIPEAAIALGKSPRTVREWCANGAIPGARQLGPRAPVRGVADRRGRPAPRWVIPAAWLAAMTPNG